MPAAEHLRLPLPSRPKRALMRAIRAGVVTLIAVPSSQLRAAVRDVPLNPGDTVVTLQARRLGIFPIDIAVRRFSGVLAYDPAAPGRCQVRLTAEVASMHMADPDRQALLLGPGFMNAARYPTFAFAGRCSAHDDLVGELTMHGITRPFALKLTWGAGRLRAEGSIARGRWGIVAMPIVVGPYIGVTITTDTK